jgi:hypothetical protein
MKMQQSRPPESGYKVKPGFELMTFMPDDFTNTVWDSYYKGTLCTEACGYNDVTACLQTQRLTSEHTSLKHVILN